MRRRPPTPSSRRGASSSHCVRVEGGAPTNLDWYSNVVAKPHESVEIGTETFAARARVAKGEERELIWRRQMRERQGFADYEEKTKRVRETAVVVLELA